MTWALDFWMACGALLLRMVGGGTGLDGAALSPSRHLSDGADDDFRDEMAVW